MGVTQDEVASILQQADKPDAKAIDTSATVKEPASLPMVGGQNPHEIDVPGFRPPEPVDDAVPKVGTSEAEVQAILEENQKQKDSSLKATFEAALAKNPDRHAAVLKLATEAHIPTDVAEAKYAELSQSWEAAKFDPAKWRKSNPELSKLIEDNPHLGTIVMKDAPLSLVTQALNKHADFTKWLDETWEPIGKYLAPEQYTPGAKAERAQKIEGMHTAQRQEAVLQDNKSKLIQEMGTEGKLLTPVLRFNESAQQMEISKLQFEMMQRRTFGQDTYDLEKKLADAKLEAVTRDYGEGPIAQLATDAAQAAASEVPVIKEGGKLAVVGAVGGAALGLALTRSVGGVAKFALRGASLFGRAGIFYGSLKLEAGSEYGDLLQAKTDDGKPLTEAEARGGALIYGTLAAVVETYSTEQLLETLGPLGKALKTGTAKSGMAELMKDSGFREIAKKAAAAWAKESATEGGEEFVQQVLQDVTTYLTRSKSAGKLQSGQVVDWEGALMAGQKGVVGGVALGAAGTAVHVASQSMTRARSVVAGQQTASLSGLADSPTVRAAPEAVAQMIEKQTQAQGEPVSHLYIDPHAFVRLFQDENSDPNEAAAALMGEEGPRQLQEAVATGNKLEIPLKDYLEKWGGKEVARRLAEDTTTQTGYLTPNELRTQHEEIQKQAEALAKEYQKDDAAQPTGAEAAYADTLEKQLVETGRMNAKEARTQVALHRAFIRSQAQVFGLNADELFRDAVVQAQKGDEGQSVAGQNDAVSHLSRRLDKMTPEERAKETYIDSNTGLLNEKAFKELKSDKPLVGHISVEGIKYLNDKVSHDHADLLYRTVGRLLHGIDPEAAKVGGDFAVRVKDEAELKSITDLLNEQMPVKGFQITGAIGEDFKKAGETHRDAKIKLEKEGLRAPRETPPLGFKGSPAELKFPAERATAAVPAALSQRVAGLSPQAYFQEAYIEPKTGVLTAAAWNAIPRKQSVAALDLRGLKLANEVFGEEFGDRMIERIGEVAKKIGGDGFDFAHLHGDEYAAQHGDPVQMERFLVKLEKALQAAPLEFWEPEEKEWRPKTVEFRFGLGEWTYENADKDLNARKEREKLGGPSQTGPEAWPFESAVELEGDGSPRPEDNAGTGRQGDQGDTSGVGQEGQVDPNLELKKQALGVISRMKPERQALALEWFRYAEGITKERPKDVPADLEKQLAEYGVVDPAGFHYDENGRSTERPQPGKRVKGDEPAELRRQRLSESAVKLFGYDPLRYEQTPPPLPTRERRIQMLLQTHEERIRKEANEHAVVIGGDGKVLLQHTSDHPGFVAFSHEQLGQIIADGNATFTHNHPSGTAVLSDMDVMLAMVANMAEMRAVTPDGVVSVVRRPEGGWSLEDPQAMKRDLERQARGAQMTARWKMDSLITEAGGNPAEGRNAKGYSDEAWKRIYGEELTKAFNAFSVLRELGWQVERVEPGANPEAVGRPSEADRRSSEVPADGLGQAGAGDQSGLGRVNQDEATSTTPRGYTEFARDGLVRIFKVALNKNADLSTFLHESGHVFLEMFSDLAERPDAPERIRNDFAQTLKWLGVESRDDLKREHHEKWARAFEAYLMEGKEPSAKLAGAFERFKLWLTQVYRSISSLNVELNDEIRGVFDRLLATDDEINQAKQRMGLDAPLLTAADFKTPQEFQRYLQDAEKATSTARRSLELRVLKDKLREAEGWWKEESAKQRKAATEEYEQLPGSRAIRYMRMGEFVLLGDNGEPSKGHSTKLDPKAVQYLLGREPNSLLKSLTKKGGLNPDDVADLFGFANGRAMLEEIERFPEKQEWVDRRTKELMESKHPDVLNDKQRMAELASKGLAGDYTAKRLLTEWKALNRKAGIVGTTPLEAIARAAKLISDQKSVRRLDVGAQLRSERAAANGVAKAIAEGNFKQAAALKQQQLLNMFLHRELLEAKDDRESFLDLANKLSDDKARARLTKASPVYRDGVDSILEALKLKQPEEREQPAASLGDVVSQMESDGATVGFDLEKLSSILAEPKEYRDLTVSDMRAVHEALKNISGAARNVATALVDGKRVAKEQVISELLTEAAANLKSKGAFPSSESARTIGKKIADGFNAFDGALLKPEQMVKFLSGGDLQSTWFRAVVEPLQKAKAAEVDILNKTVKPILDTFGSLPKEAKSHFMDKVDGAAMFPDHRKDVEAPTRRYELLMMALNAGNESNLSRLLEGRNITEDQLKKALNTLTAEELAWVQSIWDAAEGLWPASRDLEERDSGLAPPKLKPRSMALANGTLQGGYFPAIYDRRVEAAGERQQANAVAALLDPSFTRPGTSRSHLKTRVEGFSGAISLEPSNIPAHFAQVAHDLAFREAVKSVGGLILNKDVQATLKERLGDGQARQFLQWLKDVGQMRGQEGMAHLGPIMKAVRKVRGNTVIAALGYAVPNMIEDLSNIVAVLPRTDLKAKHLAAALSEFAASPMKTAEMAAGLSGELRTRHGQLQRELHRTVKQVTATGPLSRGPMEWFRHHAFAFMEFSDWATSTPVWLGSYKQALAEGLSEKEAIRKADSNVRDVFPSHSAVDQAAVLRDKGFIGSSLLFYGFLNTFYNGMRDVGHQFSKADDVGGKATQAGRMLAYVMAVTVLSEFLRGRGKEPGEDWAQWYLRKLLTGPLTSVPFGGDLSNYIDAKALHKKTNPRNQSLVGVATNLYDALEQASNENKDADKRVENLIRSIAPIVGIPASQPLRTGKYLKDVATGNRTVRNPADFVGGLIYGEHDGQPVNPASAVGDAISGER
jgi:GGDEF domain-containing protein